MCKNVCGQSMCHKNACSPRLSLSLRPSARPATAAVSAALLQITQRLLTSGFSKPNSTHFRDKSLFVVTGNGFSIYLIPLRHLTAKSRFGFTWTGPRITLRHNLFYASSKPPSISPIPFHPSTCATLNRNPVSFRLCAIERACTPSTRFFCFLRIVSQIRHLTFLSFTLILTFILYQPTLPPKLCHVFLFEPSPTLPRLANNDTSNLNAIAPSKPWVPPPTSTAPNSLSRSLMRKEMLSVMPVSSSRVNWATGSTIR